MRGPYSTIVSLVGENPLPIYFGIRQFAAPGARIVLVHSDRTTEEARNVAKAVGAALDRVTYESIADPYSPADAREFMEDLARRHATSDAALNFTGGTKVMSAFALDAWRARRQNAFYLDEAGGMFRFADGVDVPLDIQPPLTLKDVCSLHGVGSENKGDRLVVPNVDRAMWNVLRDIGNTGLEGVDSSKDGYIWLEKQFKSQEPRVWDGIVGSLPQPAPNWRLSSDFPSSKNAYDRSDLKRQFKHLHGVWLETLLYDLLLSLGADGGVHQTTEKANVLLHSDSVQLGGNFKYGGSQFEADIVVVHENRVRYFSVTTDATAARTKAKAFEAIHRAMQVGGGLARAAVVCPVRDDVRRECQNAIDPAGRRHVIFGMEALRSWLDDGDARDLREFIVNPAG
jgi:hypothetical protein